MAGEQDNAVVRGCKRDFYRTRKTLEGVLTFQLGGHTITARAGDSVYSRGIVHSFKNMGEVSVQALVLTTPAGLEGFFSEVFEPAWIARQALRL